MDYDSNIIKPVESLDNITGISASRGRQERKQKQRHKYENQDYKQASNEIPKIPDHDEPDKQGIDYSA